MMKKIKSFVVDACAGVQLLRRVGFFGIPWNVVRQAPLSVGFSRQEYWSGLPFPSQKVISFGILENADCVTHS